MTFLVLARRNEAALVFHVEHVQRVGTNNIDEPPLLIQPKAG